MMKLKRVPQQILKSDERKSEEEMQKNKLHSYPPPK